VVSGGSTAREREAVARRGGRVWFMGGEG